MKIQTTFSIAAVMLIATNPWHNVLAEIYPDQFRDSAIYEAVDGAFSETEQQLINEYFKEHRDSSDHEYGGGKHKKNKKGKNNKKQKGMPPGLAKKSQLPPGLQKQLDRNGTLPPGLAKRSLPSDLERRLPPVNNGMERVIADTHVLLVDKATGIIRDIIKDIVP